MTDIEIICELLGFLQDVHHKLRKTEEAAVPLRAHHMGHDLLRQIPLLKVQVEFLMENAEAEIETLERRGDDL